MRESACRSFLPPHHDQSVSIALYVCSCHRARGSAPTSWFGARCPSMQLLIHCGMFSVSFSEGDKQWQAHMHACSNTCCSYILVSVSNIITLLQSSCNNSASQIDSVCICLPTVVCPCVCLATWSSWKFSTVTYLSSWDGTEIESTMTFRCRRLSASICVSLRHVSLCSPICLVSTVCLSE